MSIEAGILYIVATPIGNLEDISNRALATLQRVDRIAAEDTRHSKRLLQHYGIEKPMVALHEHNETKLSSQLIEWLEGGEHIALISDAGTPLISDPGYPLVRLAHQAGVKVVPIPGPSALTAALSVSGLPTDRFCFEGFLPAKGGARRKKLQALVSESRTMVFYESPHRILESLQDMADVLGDQREVLLARELSKNFETLRLAPLDQLLPWVASDSNQQRGEFVLVVAGAGEESSQQELEGQRLARILAEELPKSQAAALAARISGCKKRALYDYLMRLD